MGLVLFVLIVLFATVCGLELLKYYRGQETETQEVVSSDILLDGYLELIENEEQLDIDQIRSRRDILVNRMKLNRAERQGQGNSEKMPANVLSFSYFQKKFLQPVRKMQKNS